MTSLLLAHSALLDLVKQVAILGGSYDKNLRVTSGGAWVAQSVEHPTSAQVVISWFVGSSPVSGSVLTAQSLEPASDSVSLSLCPSPTHTLSVSQK